MLNRPHSERTVDADYARHDAHGVGDYCSCRLLNSRGRQNCSELMVHSQTFQVEVGRKRVE